MLKNLKISRKIASAFIGLFLIALCMGATVWANIGSVESAGQRLTAHANLQLTAGDIRFAMTRQENSLRGYLLTHDKYYSDRVAKHGDTVKKYVGMARAAAAGDAALLGQLDKLSGAIDAWYEQIAKPAMILAANSADPNEAADLIASDKANALRDPAESIVDGLRDGENKLFTAASADLTASNETSVVALEIGLGLFLAAAAGLGFGLTRAIARPVRSLNEAMTRLSEGDHEMAVPALDRRDEIGSMARSVQVFKDAAIERRRLEAEAETSRAAQALSRERQTAIDNAKAEDLKVFVHAVEESFERLAVGDLTVRMDGTVAAEFEPIRHRFNEAVGSLEDAIGSVVGSIGSIRNGLGEITVAAGDLSQRTEQQAASLEETVAALGEVTRGVNGTAGSAASAQATAEAAQATASRGEAVVAEAVAAMGAIEASSEKIGRIIGVIDEIAFQTNLLALNAGVEAARAGEAGRGFAVVALEVRGLAQRSAEAAREIKDLIHTSAAQVGQGVELVTASGRSLSEIVGQVAGMAEVVSGIASSAREQAGSLREVSSAADNMDKVTQQNAAMVEETTAAAQSLAGETEELARLTERFRTKSATSGGWGSSAAAPRGRPTAPLTPLRPAAAPVRQMKHAGPGGAVPKPAAQPDDWEEF